MTKRCNNCDHQIDLGDELLCLHSRSPRFSRRVSGSGLCEHYSRRALRLRVALLVLGLVLIGGCSAVMLFDGFAR